MSGKFKYRYVRDLSDPSRKLYKAPFLQVRLAYGGRHVDIAGLLDTGAADCIFDVDVADDLGLNLKDTDVEKEYFGIAGQSVVGYVHRVDLQVQGFSEWIEIDAGFLDTKLPYPLIGESGVFDNYQITFMRYRGRFEMKSRTFLRRP